jgi:hypothetical protein
MQRDTHPITRTQWAERHVEDFLALPLVREFVLRSPQTIDGVQKEVADHLVLHGGAGILIFLHAPRSTADGALFRLSPLAKRRKAQTRQDYIPRTLKRAFQSQETVYEPGRQAKPPRPVGRPTSTTTQRVVKFATANPKLRPAAIARSLGLPPGTVRVVLHRGRAVEKRAGL